MIALSQTRIQSRTIGLDSHQTSDCQMYQDIAEQIDWTIPVEFLDKEFTQLTPNSEIGKRFADQLVKVYQKGGNSIILLIHLEVQAEPEDIFPERIFTYLVQIFDYFHQIPISLAILCDSDKDQRPSEYDFCFRYDRNDPFEGSGNKT